MKIFDCFMFNNELDLLELRLTELYNYVDVFVIVESNLTHTCRQKPHWFEKYSNRYSQWSDKIRYIKHTSTADLNPWVNEGLQRNAIIEGISDANSDDVVIISDLDEIVRPDCITSIKNNNHATLYGFHMPLFNFKFNYMRTTPGRYDIWASAAKYSWIKKYSPQILRNQKENLAKLPFTFISQQEKVVVNSDDVQIFQHGGWHFSDLGDNSWLREKALNTCHQENITPNFIDQIDVDKSIRKRTCWNQQWPYQYEIVKLTDYFPKSCRNYPNFCLDGDIDINTLLP